MAEKRTLTAVKPASIELTDGVARDFLLTRGGMERVKKALNLATDRDLLDQPNEKLIHSVLLEAQVSKNGDALTEEQLLDLLPMDQQWNIRAFALVMGVSLPDPIPTEAGASPPNE